MPTAKGLVDLKYEILMENEKLASEVQSGKITDLEALAQLTEYSASLTPNCTKCFIESLGSVLTGHSSGHSWRDEVSYMFTNKFFGNPYPPLDTEYGDATKLGQSGFADIFQDPSTSKGGGNQSHHYWFYIQVGFESGAFMAGGGDWIHENILANDPSGMSINDLYLGFEGAKLGVKLADRSIMPSEVGNYIRQTLSPGSDEAIYYQKPNTLWSR